MTFKTKYLLTLFLFATISYDFTAQEIAEDAKVYIEFKDVKHEVNVNGRDAIGMFESYIEGYTYLKVVSEKEQSDITFILSVFEKNLGIRKGKIIVRNSKTGDDIFDTGWVKGGPLVFYGYSGTRHAIARAFIDEFLEEYEHINQKK